MTGLCNRTDQLRAAYLLLIEVYYYIVVEILTIIQNLSDKCYKMENEVREIWIKVDFQKLSHRNQNHRWEIQNWIENRQTKIFLLNFVICNASKFPSFHH